MATSVEGMSCDQLREQLYHSLKGRGVLDSVKTQLRTRLATELQKSVPKESTKSSRQKRPRSSSAKHHQHPPGSHSTALRHHIASSIVAEYLKKAGFEYSLSVFIPEAEVSIGKLISVEDLVQYLRIPPSSPLATSLQSSQHRTGLLVQLLEALLENSSSLHTSRNNGSDQTPPPDAQGAGSPVHARASRRSKGLTVDEQLQALELSYAQKAEQHSLRYQQNVEERLSAFQRDLEAQYKKQLETELTLYRTRELSKMRLEEREKYQEDLARERLEMTQNSQKRIDELRKSESQMMERFRKKEQDLDAGIHLQRQALLDEMSALKVRESELKRQSELNKKAASLEEERVKGMVEQLEGKEKALHHMKEHFDKMAEDKAEKYKFKFESQLQLKQNELSKWESELIGEREKMSSLKSETQRLTIEVQTEREKAERLHTLLQEATARQITLQGQKDALQQRIDQMGDYRELQQRSHDLQQEVATLEKKFSETKSEYKRRVSDQQRLIKDLQAKVSHPTSELDTLQRELDQLRDAHQKQIVAMECDNRELTRQLSVQTEYSRRLQDRLDEQLVQLMSAQREVQDVHSLIEHLKPGAVRGGSKKSGVKTANKRVPTALKLSTLHPSRQHTPSPTFHSTHTSHPYNSNSPQEEALLLAASSLGNGPTTQGVSFSDASSQLLAETRATFARLEKEAEELEQQFHHNNNSRPNLMYTNHRGSDNLPPTPLINKYQGPPSEQLVDPTLQNQVLFTSDVLTTTQSPLKTTISVPNPYSAIQLPRTHLSSMITATPPLTETVWSASTAMTAKTSPPLMELPPSSVNIHDNTTIQPFVSLSPPVESAPSKQVLLSNQSPLLPTSASYSTVELTTSQTKPRISLDELWKSSKHQKHSDVDDTSPKNNKECLDNKTQQSEEVGGGESIENQTTKTGLEDLPNQDGQQKEKLTHETDPPLNSNKNDTLDHNSPPLGHLQGGGHDKEQSHSAEDVADPVMLKYMELVKQRRDNEAIQVVSQQLPSITGEDEGNEINSKLDNNFGIPSLSQGSDNFNGFSDKEDLFDDW